MLPQSADPTAATLEPLIRLIGAERWRRRLNEIRDLAAAGPRAGQAIRQRHVVELTIEKLRRPTNPPHWVTEALLGRIAQEITAVAARLTRPGRDRLVEQLRLCLTDANTLIPVFHLIRTASLQQSRGFAVTFTGLDHGTPHDLVLRRDNTEAHVACDVVTAEEGRGLHRGAWFRLADRIDPDLQTWLAAHPGAICSR